MSEPFVILIAGSRSYDDYNEFCKKMDFILQDIKNIKIVSGGAKGADTMAAKYAKEHDYDLKEFLAQWETYGKSAGFRRNEQMHQYLMKYKNRGCICFWDGESKGTAHNFGLCKKYKTPLRVWNFQIKEWNHEYDI